MFPSETNESVQRRVTGRRASEGKMFPVGTSARGSVSDVTTADVASSAASVSERPNGSASSARLHKNQKDRTSRKDKSRKGSGSTRASRSSCSTSGSGSTSASKSKRDDSRHSSFGGSGSGRVSVCETTIGGESGTGGSAALTNQTDTSIVSSVVDPANSSSLPVLVVKSKSTGTTSGIEHRPSAMDRCKSTGSIGKEQRQLMFLQQQKLQRDSVDVMQQVQQHLQDTPAQQAPSQDAPAQQALSQDALAQDALSQDAPVQQRNQDTLTGDNDVPVPVPVVSSDLLLRRHQACASGALKRLQKDSDRGMGSSESGTFFPSPAGSLMRSSTGPSCATPLYDGPDEVADSFLSAALIVRKDHGGRGEENEEQRQDRLLAQQAETGNSYFPMDMGLEPPTSVPPPPPFAPTSTPSPPAPPTAAHRAGTPSTPGRALHRRQLSLSVSISRHYELNNQFLSIFDATYKNHLWLVCYEIGRNFVETALFDIPKHGYYNSTRHKEERVRLSLDTLRVSDLLTKVVGRMAEAEAEAHARSGVGEGDYGAGNAPLVAGRQEIKEAELNALRNEAAGLAEMAKRQAEDLGTLETYLADRDGILAKADGNGERADEKAGENVHCAVGTEEIIEDLNNLSFCCASSSDWSLFSSLRPSSTSLSRQQSWQASIQQQQQSQRQQSQQHPSTKGSPPPSSSLYPSLSDMPPRDHFGSPYMDDIREESFVFAGDVGMGSFANDQAGLDHLPRGGKRRHSDVIPMESLRQCYWEDWQSLKNQDKILFTFLDTHQGRVPESTNGCTVIAPLLAIHHLQGEGPGIADSIIDEVIDDQASTILPEVRSLLGLTPDALIIPSDVHDYLIKRGLLSQDQFVGVCGGNIMDKKHVDQFLHMLNCESEHDRHKGKKVAAALFFHGHVISILKMNLSDGRCWYDFIDSMPSAMTMTGTPDEMGWVKSAVRIRCKSLESLDATLKWYSCSKFTEDDCLYIDMFQWEDSRADFDPRVFQAFVWAEWAMSFDR